MTIYIKYEVLLSEKSDDFIFDSDWLTKFSKLSYKLLVTVRYFLNLPNASSECRYSFGN